MSDTQFELIALLNENRILLEKVTPFLDEERRCILESDLDGLSAVVDGKAEILGVLQSNSGRCSALVQLLAAELGEAEVKSLSPLLPKLQQPEQDRLRGVQRAFLDAGATFERLSRNNGYLLTGALLTVNRSLSFFGCLLNHGATYSGAGRMVGGTQVPRLLHREG